MIAPLDEDVPATTNDYASMEVDLAQESTEIPRTCDNCRRNSGVNTGNSLLVVNPENPPMTFTDDAKECQFRENVVEDLGIVENGNGVVMSEVNASSMTVMGGSTEHPSREKIVEGSRVVEIGNGDMKSKAHDWGKSPMTDIGVYEGSLLRESFYDDSRFVGSGNGVLMSRASSWENSPMTSRDVSKEFDFRERFVEDPPFIENGNRAMMNRANAWENSHMTGIDVSEDYEFREGFVEDPRFFENGNCVMMRMANVLENSYMAVLDVSEDYEFRERLVEHPRFVENGNGVMMRRANGWENSPVTSRVAYKENRYRGRFIEGSRPARNGKGVMMSRPNAPYTMERRILPFRPGREHIRARDVGRKKDFVCIETIEGEPVNILDGLELHTRVFSDSEQKEIVNYVYDLQDMGRRGELKERTYSEPIKWMRGKGRITIQFGCCYNYAKDKNGNLPGIVRDEVVDPLPDLFKLMIKRLVRWRVLPPACVPDSCIVNIYEEGDCIPPHIDNHEFVRPFCTVSFLSECDIVFGSKLKIDGPGEFSGSYSLRLPLGSVLVLKGNGADIAEHCVPSVPRRRISITFRKMDERRRPYMFKPDPDLQDIQPFNF